MSVTIRTEDVKQLSETLHTYGLQRKDAQVAAAELWKERQATPTLGMSVQLPDTLVINPIKQTLVSTPKFPVTGSAAAGLHQYAFKQADGACDYVLLSAAAADALKTPSDR